MTWRYNGAIPRLEPKEAQIDVVQSDARPNAVMIDAFQVSRFLNRGFDAQKLEPPVIVSSTFDDEQLEYWHPDRELDIARKMGADAAIPCDRPAYKQDATSFRRETIESYAADLRDQIPEYDDAGIEVIPLVKGEAPYERRLCYDVFDDYGIKQIAYYCAQYFTYGYRFPELVERIQDITAEFDPENIMLIGLQSENLLPELPPNVTAAAGQRWLREINYGRDPSVVMQQQFSHWKTAVESALNIGQLPLDAFTTERGWV